MSTQPEGTRLSLIPTRTPTTPDRGNEGIVDALKTNRSSRREFIKVSGLAVAGTGLGLPTAALATAGRAEERDPGSVLARLIEGNKRFVSGQLAHPGRRPEDFAPLAEGQAPLAIIRRYQK